MVIAIISDAYSICSKEMKQKPKVNVTNEIYQYCMQRIERLPFGVGEEFRVRRRQAEAELERKQQEVEAKAAELEQRVAAGGRPDALVRLRLER